MDNQMLPRENDSPVVPVASNKSDPKHFVHHFLALVGILFTLGMAGYLYFSYVAGENYNKVAEEANKARWEMDELKKKRNAGFVNVSPGGVIVSIYRHGGMCVEGGECSSVHEIMIDGRITVGDSNSGKMTNVDLDNLKRELRAVDYDSLGAIPFSGTCPMAYDGQENVYTFYPNGVERVYADCKVYLDENLPIFKILSGVLYGRPSFVPDLSDWKTYRNEEYGFELKYPRDWEFTDTVDKSCLPRECLFAITKFASNQTKEDLDFHDGVDMHFSAVSMLTRDIEKYVQYPKLYPSGKDFLAYEFRGSSQDESDYQVSAFRELSNGSVIIFDWHRFGNSIEDLSYDKYLDQILSTFRSIN